MNYRKEYKYQVEQELKTIMRQAPDRETTQIRYDKSRTRYEMLVTRGDGSEAHGAIILSAVAHVNALAIYGRRYKLNLKGIKI